MHVKQLCSTSLSTVPLHLNDIPHTPHELRASLSPNTIIYPLRTVQVTFELDAQSTRKMAEAAAPPKSYSLDPALYIYTSLTSGSSHIVTATSRLETILRANRVPFKALDLATDEKARMLWGRRAGKDDGGRVRKLPGLVQMGLVLGVIIPPTSKG